MCVESQARFGKELFKVYGANKGISIIGNAEHLLAVWYISPTDTQRLDTGF